MILVRDLMTSEVATLRAQDRLSLAEDIMKLGRIRHLPIIDANGHLCGILTQRDLFRGALAKLLGYGPVAQDKIFQSLIVEDIMCKQVVAIGPNVPIVEAASVMEAKKIGCLPVVEGEKLVGIITEADFVTYSAYQRTQKPR